MGKDSYLLKGFWVPTPEGFLGLYSRRVLGSLLPKIKKRKETKRNLGREYEPLQATCELRQHTPAKKRRVGKSHGAALFGPPSEKRQRSTKYPYSKSPPRDLPRYDETYERNGRIPGIPDMLWRQDPRRHMEKEERCRCFPRAGAMTSCQPD